MDPMKLSLNKQKKNYQHNLMLLDFKVKKIWEILVFKQEKTYKIGYLKSYLSIFDIYHITLYLSWRQKIENYKILN